MVTVVGRLERNGRIVFPERAFTQAESSKLRTTSKSSRPTAPRALRPESRCGD